MSAVEKEVSATIGKELTLPERAAVALRSQQTEKDLLALATAHKDITTVTNRAGREQVHTAYMALKKSRIEIEKRGEEAREDANAIAKAIIAEQARLAEEARAREEQARIEREAEAKRQKEEADRLAAERAELERLRAEQAERDRVARERIEAAERAAAAERERAEAEARAAREAEEQRLADARAKLEAERQALEAARAPKPEPAVEPVADDYPGHDVIVETLCNSLDIDEQTAVAWIIRCAEALS